jgi:hypothetical protein
MPGDREKDTASLEPPSLFRRRKKPTPAPEPDREPDAEAGRGPAPEPRALSEPSGLAPAPQPLVEAEPAAAVAPPLAPLEQTAPLVADSPATDSPTTIVDDTSEPKPPQESGEPEEPKRPREPWLHGVPAAVVTGLFIGVLIVAATAASLRLCSAVKGTSSCGGPGFFLLVAILVVAVLLGAAMLRAARVPEATSTSFLAVGLLSIVALLFLVGSIFEWWMTIVIPLCSMATFLLSYWVTTTYIEPAS